MKKLGVDLGERRIGFAISDDNEQIAMPLITLSTKNINQTIDLITQQLQQENTPFAVIGYPRQMNGKRGSKAKEAELVLLTLQERGFSGELWDERLTTAEADRLLINADYSRKERKQRIDAVAAQRILASYLATKNLPSPTIEE